MSIQSMFQRAIEHHQVGRLPEAAGLYRQILEQMPRHADALHLLGVIALQSGNSGAAVDLIQKAIQIRPADNFYCNLGNAFKEQDRRGEAIASFRQALALNGSQAEALCNLGSALLDEGKVDEAIASCRRAIALKPGFAAAYCNLGNALLKQGLLDEAVGCYRQTLRIDPGLAVAYGNLGDALCLMGLAGQAIDCYRQALSTGPDTAELHCKIGRAFRQQGHLERAIGSYVEALKRSDHDHVRAEFVQSIRTAHFHAPHAEARACVLRALEEAWADPGDLLTPATSLVEAQPAVRQGIAHARQAAPALLGPTLLAEMAADRLLLSLLETDAINSIALERLLTLARRQMLDAALATADGQQDLSAPDPAAVFHGALARQCFINEYVYACSDDESAQFTRLRDRLDACLANGMVPDPRWLVASAAYAPLSSLAGAEAWAALPWPAPLAALFTQQVSEPAIERRHRATMPCLTGIEDRVSRLVREQYEESPYPRWIRAPRVAAPTTVDTLLPRQFPGAPFLPLGTAGPLDVLVAGCGTGQHPIQVAQQFKEARVLAVDLSLSSLCYAQRKTEELGLGSINYAQADILNLGALGQRFDLIESAGVLHHLADPVAGWQVLLKLLRPGGLMLLGLYSELGRRDVVAARRRIAERGFAAKASDIRRCRQELMSDDLAPQFEQFLASRDFYSTSACRDLLFHVQEHRYTLPQLKEILARLGLNFIGFALEPEVTAAYARQFPDDPARTNLDQWHAFETARPETFCRMYQFWVQKPGVR